MGLIATGIEAHAIDRPGGIFVRSAEQISLEDRTLLQAVARVIISDSRGTLMEQVNRRGLADKSVARLAVTRSHRLELAPRRPMPSRPDLILGNHLGAFTAGRLGVRDFHHGIPADADSLGQRSCESELRHGRDRKRHRLHLERERARIPPDALERRPGRRDFRRSDLPARRGKRALLVAVPFSERQSIALRHAPRLWLHGISSTRWAASTRNCGSTWTSKKRSSSPC